MEVTSVEAVPLRRELDERFANAQKWIESREYCLVRVEADDGTVGWGECWGPVAGNRELLERRVGPWLVGRDPLAVERVHDELVFDLRSAYHSTVPTGVVSGVDVALWDLKGKALGESVASLLGGRRRDEVRAYATGHFFRDVDSFDRLRELFAEEAAGHVAAGFDAVKVKIGLNRHFPAWGAREDVDLVRAVREAVGDDVRVMADANHAYDRATARRVAEGLADLDAFFFEEPMPPEHVDAYAALNAAVDVPLAGGECWAFREEFGRPGAPARVRERGRAGREPAGAGDGPRRPDAGVRPHAEPDPRRTRRRPDHERRQRRPHPRPTGHRRGRRPGRRRALPDRVVARHPAPRPSGPRSAGSLRRTARTAPGSPILITRRPEK
jgi:D-galactarolactone cycloisomerase